MKKIIKILDTVIDWFLVFILSAVIIVVMLQILFRFVIQKPLSWSEELSRYLFIWLVYIGGYVCTRSNSHLGLTFFVDSMPKKMGKIMSIISNGAVFIYQIIVISFGFQLVSRVMRQPSAVLRVPMGFIYLAIPLGMLLMFIREILNLIEHKSNRSEGSL